MTHPHPFHIPPFLSLPFRRAPEVTITEGWNYSKEERAIHGHETHFGIDFAAPRETPVHAAADGYAVSSYHLVYLKKKYKRRIVGFGLGNFVQIWHPEQGVYTCYAHLDQAAHWIPYLPAVRHEGKNGMRHWDPSEIYHSPEEIMTRAVRVERGDIIGFVGDTGLAWGYQETPDQRPNSNEFPSWDETHLHFEVYCRGGADDGYKKQHRFDPYGIYGSVDRYRGITPPQSQMLWLLTEQGEFTYAQG